MGMKPLYTAVATSHGGRDGHVKSTSITNHVTLNETDAGGYAISVELHASLPGVPRAEAEAPVQAAHQVCPYSVATRGNVEVTLVVE